jgi:hypothetical protein
MYWQYNGCMESRGTILVASSHALFAEVVGEMVARCGFAPAYFEGQEAPLALARTQPCLVICDCAAPAEGIQSLIVDASARHIPLVLSDARMKLRVDEGSLVLPQRVSWLTFPVSRDAFAAMLDALLPSPARAARDVTAGVAVELADVQELRSAIASALAARPVCDQSLRRAVWTYVGAERDAGTSPARVIVLLIELVEAARVGPMSIEQSLTRRVILWCVEAYFGQLDDDVARVGDLSDAGPVLVLVDD